jgi:phosphoglycolate phosphatase
MTPPTVRKPPVAVFDLDGTLADTAPDLVASLNAVLATENLPPLPLAKARDMIGAGGRVLIERGLEAEGLEVTPARLEEMYHAFLAHYAEHLVDRSELFPGVVEALDALERAGFALAVCTNKIEAHSVQLLEVLGLGGRFAAVCGRDSFPFYKPDPRHLTLTIERAGGEPGRAVMVGDSRTDIATAKAAGVPVVAVTFGYTDTPVRELNPDRVVDDFADVVEAVQDLVRVPA